MTLLAPEITIRGEYWIKPDNGISPVEADGGHEQEAIQEACIQVANLLDPDSLNFGEPDLISAQNLLKDLLFENNLKAEALVTSGLPHAEELAALNAVLNFKTDARLYAERTWGWIRISQNNVEAHKLDEIGARKLREALLDIAVDHEDISEHEALDLEVRCYVGQRCYACTIANLGDALGMTEKRIDPAGEAAGKIASGILQTAHRDSMHPCYKGVLGD